MPEQEPEFIKLVHEKALCCACDRPMRDSAHVNVVATDRRVGRHFCHSLAVVCDGCIKAKARPRYAIGLRDDNEFVYHELSGPPGPQPAANIYGDLVCPTCGANIITPPQQKVVPGIGRCLLCKRHFFVSAELAKLVNEIADAYRELNKALDAGPMTNPDE